MTRAPFPASPFSGPNLMGGLNTRFKQLYDAASFTLTSVGGTANAVTATLAPALDGDGLLNGMTFTVVWGAANTGGVTLAINGGSPISVLAYDGTALTAGALGDGLVSRVTYFGGDFILTSPSLLMGGSGAGSFYFVFTSSGTFTKPDGLSDDRRIFVEAWGGGGGGGSNGGGGGGAYMPQWFRAADLGATVTVTIGAGGGVAVSGGNTTFGALLTAYGGGHGYNAGGTGAGGGGGGTHQAGGVGTNGIGGAGGFQGGGAGTVGAGENATTENGGAGGAGAGDSSGGGRAVRGGGGGSRTASGGVSLFAGDGGATGVAGSAPAGGGGLNASGARGELRIWI